MRKPLATAFLASALASFGASVTIKSPTEFRPGVDSVVTHVDLTDLAKSSESESRAWGIYDSHTGEPSPVGYTVISSTNIMIAKGMSYRKTVTSNAEVWVLTADEPYEPTGISTNGGFHICDGDGNIQFEIVKGDKVVVSAQPSSVTVTNLSAINSKSVTNQTLYVAYDIISSSHPACEVCLSLEKAEWKTESDPDCPATVAWSGSSGHYVAAITPKITTSRCFAKATYRQNGVTYINNRCAVGMSRIVLGGIIYCLGTARINGHTVLTLTPAN